MIPSTNVHIPFCRAPRVPLRDRNGLLGNSEEHGYHVRELVLTSIHSRQALNQLVEIDNVVLRFVNSQYVVQTLVDVERFVLCSYPV